MEKQQAGPTSEQIQAANAHLTADEIAEEIRHIVAVSRLRASAASVDPSRGQKTARPRTLDQAR